MMDWKEKGNWIADTLVRNERRFDANYRFAYKSVYGQLNAFADSAGGQRCPRSIKKGQAFRLASVY